MHFYLIAKNNKKKISNHSHIYMANIKLELGDDKLSLT